MRRSLAVREMSQVAAAWPLDVQKRNDALRARSDPNGPFRPINLWYSTSSAGSGRSIVVVVGVRVVEEVVFVGTRVFKRILKRGIQIVTGVDIATIQVLFFLSPLTFQEGCAHTNCSLFQLFSYGAGRIAFMTPTVALTGATTGTFGLGMPICTLVTVGGVSIVLFGGLKSFHGHEESYLGLTYLVAENFNFVARRLQGFLRHE